MLFRSLRRTRDYMLVYSSGSLETVGYTDSNFQKDIDFRKSTSEYVFTFNGGVIISKIASKENLADTFIKSLSERVFERHVNSMGLKRIPYLL